MRGIGLIAALARGKLIKDLLNVVNQKIGSITDIYSVNESLFGFQNAFYKHIHNPGFVYPADGTNINVVTSATEKTFGSFVELVPANTITVAFDTHWANIAEISANGTYVVEFWLVDEELAPVKYLTAFSITRGDNFTKLGEAFIQVPVIHANSRIAARALKGTAGAGTISLNIHYHTYE